MSTKATKSTSVVAEKFPKHRRRATTDRVTLAVVLAMALGGTLSVAGLVYFVAQGWRWVIIPIVLPVWVVVLAGTLSPAMREDPDRLDRLALISATIAALVIIAGLVIT